VNSYLADFIKNFELENIPKEVVLQAKKCLTDLVACAISGADVLGAKILSSFVRGSMAGRECTIIKAQQKASAVGASLVNGFILNALDIDDAYTKIKGHPGALIFPSALALAELCNASGKELLEALIIGYEVGIRTGLAVHSTHREYHGSGSWGSVAAASAGAKLLKLDKKSIRHALGIAEAHAPMTPIMRCVMQPRMAPKDGAAWGAMVGTSSALLAKEGFTGISTLLEQKENKFLASTLGKNFEMLNLVFKRYPCCGWSHAAIDGLLKVMKGKNISYKDIEKITISVFWEATKLSRKWPTTIEEAEYSLLYPVAAAAVASDFGLAQLTDESRSSPETKALAKKIEIEHDPELDKYFPAEVPAIVRIRLKNGKTYSSGKISPLGPKGESLSREEIREKFFELVRRSLTKTEAKELLSVIENLEKHRIADLLKFLE